MSPPLWERPGIDGPATHVLVVGIGAYRHQVAGGKAPRARPVQAVARSARAVLDWVFEARSGFEPPLASVHAALSDPSDTAPVIDTPAGPRPVPAPTLAGLKPVIAQWYARLNAAPGSTALVYLAGHGIANASSFLLAEDYGADPMDAYAGLIDIDGFFTVMQTLDAGALFVFADCCQEFEAGLFRQIHGVVAESFGSADYTDLKNAPHILVKAAEPGGKSRADRDRRTYFCDGLLYALRGAAARGAADGRWRVTAASLQQALVPSAARCTGRTICPEWHYVYSQPPAIVSFADPPEVEVMLRTDPAAAIFAGRLAVSHQDLPDPIDVEPDGFDVRVTLTARAGYLAEATFARGDYRRGWHGFAAEPFCPPVILRTPAQSEEG